MARFKGYPKDYAPALRYWLREQPEGGALPAPGTLLCYPQVLARRECLVLIHGYNNHAGEAAAAYIGFRHRECGWFDDLTPEKLENAIGDAHWPGDSAWAGPLDWLDFAFYPFAVGVAKNAGPQLADLLHRLPNLERVHFIAHSLGCRVALETIARLRADGYPAMGRVCLMAAAVPCEMVESGGRFEALLRSLAVDGVEVRVLHSTEDRVLRFAFPPGQTAAGEPTVRALGLNGPPVDMPGRGANVSELRIDGATHGDYWGHSTTVASEEATRDAGIFLRLGDHPREFKARSVGAPRDTGNAREVGWSRDLAPGD